MAKKPNKTVAGTNIKNVQKHNQNADQYQQNQQYNAEFGSETDTAQGTDAKQVKKQNQMAANEQYESEFADETNAKTVKKQNQKSQAKKK